MKTIVTGLLILSSFSTFAQTKLQGDVDQSLSSVKGLIYNGDTITLKKNDTYIFSKNGTTRYNVYHSGLAQCWLTMRPVTVDIITDQNNKYEVTPSEFKLKNGQEIKLSYITDRGSVYKHKVHMQIDSPKELSGFLTLYCNNQDPSITRIGRQFILDDLESTLSKQFTIIKH